MKQFNLEEYLRLKEEGKEPRIITRSGCKAEILKAPLDNPYYPVAVSIFTDPGETPRSVSAEGRYIHGNSEDHELDLFFADPEPSYRPYKDAEECFRDVLKHGGWVKDKYAIRHVSQITFKEPQGLVDDQVQIRGCNGRTYKEFLNDFTYADDGSACGVKED